MPTIEERVVYLEEKVGEHSGARRDIKDSIIHMGQKFEQRFINLEQRLFETNGRIDETHKRIDKLFYFIIATLVSPVGSLIGIIVSIS